MTQPRPITPPPAPKKKKKIWPWIAVALLVFGTIGAYVNWKNATKEPVRQESSTETRPTRTESTAPPETENKLVVTFDGNYYVDGDEAPWLDLYYKTEYADGGAYVSIQVEVDTDYLTQNYSPWTADIYCFDSEDQIVSYTHCSLDEQNKISEPFCVFIPDSALTGTYLWAAEIYQSVSETPVASATMEFVVERSN